MYFENKVYFKLILQKKTYDKIVDLEGKIVSFSLFGQLPQRDDVL